jgi:hypothetical protein
MAVDKVQLSRPHRGAARHGRDRRCPDGAIRVAAPAKLWLTAPAAKLRLATDE